MRKIPAAVLVFVACKFEGSCGGSTLNMDKARDFIGTTYERELGQYPQVTCPESVKAQAGATFDCTVSFGDVKATITIKQDDDKGSVTIVSITGLLVASKLETTIAAGLKDRVHSDFKVNCGPRVRASTPGTQFSCDATEVGGGRSAKIAVSVKDNAGNVEWKTEDARAP